MATYLQGVTDAVTTLNPPDPNLQFNMQLLQMRQSKYDQAHAKLSKMYGTILNSGLTRDDNIAAREEFFKLVETDLQKIAGMDLSLDSNVSKAQNVFKQFYTNNHIVKDMVWTKNYQSQQKRADAFKNCVDHEKCGGQYWEEGEKYLAYKRQEFKNMSADESLSAEDVRYIPYNNMMDQALKDLKEMGGFDMKFDEIKGDYKYTTKNGEVIEQPLLNLFNQLYEKNPEFHDMYKVMAYNKRQDWMYSKMQDGTYKNLNEAQVGYIKEYRDAFEKNFNERSKHISTEKERLGELVQGYEEDIQAGRLRADDPAYLETKALYSNATALDSYNQLYRNAQKNMHSQQSLGNLSGYLDDIEAGNLFDSDIQKTVETLKWKGYEQTIELEEKAKMRIEHEYDVALENLKFEHDKELELVKGEIKAALEGSKFSAEAYTAQQTYNNAFSTAENFNPIAKALADAGANDYEDELADAINGTGKWAGKSIEERKEHVASKLGTHKAKFLDKYNGAITQYGNNKRTSNSAALKAIEKAVTKNGNLDFVPSLYTDANSLSDADINTLEGYRLNYPDIPALQELYQQYKHRLPGGGVNAPANSNTGTVASNVMNVAQGTAPGILQTALTPGVNFTGL